MNKTLSELETLYDEYIDRDPDRAEKIEVRIKYIREHGEPIPSLRDELREDFKRDNEDSIEFLKGDIGVLSEIATMAGDDSIRQYAEYFIRIDLDDLKECYKRGFPEWLR